MAKTRKRRPLLRAALLLAAVAVIGTLFFPNWLRQLQYPMKLESLVRETAAEYGLNPPLVAAVIYTESKYNASAVSSAGAMGLMQIMPETGEWIAHKLDWPFTDETLFDPRANARLGAWYLRFLLDRYDGRVQNAIAAYHAGQGSVDAWLEDARYSSDGLTLERAGSSSTQHYINKVLSAYENYQILDEAS